MDWYRMIALGALCYCALVMAAHFVRLVRKGAPKDLSRRSGSVGKGVLYANTVAMMPNQKESAFMHLPNQERQAGFRSHVEKRKYR